MNKVAVFVEGQAELIFVREFLLKMYCWDVGIECYNLCSDNLSNAPYHFPEDTENRQTKDCFYMIVNAGNDRTVLSTMKKRLSGLVDNGFDKVIGLRDMYCDDYHKACEARTITPSINQKFIDGHNDQIAAFSHPDKVRFFFAIMEIEAWILAIPSIFERIDPDLTVDEIREKLNIDFSLDPETTYYHPAKTLGEILGLAEMGYDKHKDEVERLVGNITREDFQKLAANEDKCTSFRVFSMEIMS